MGNEREHDSLHTGSWQSCGYQSRAFFTFLLQATSALTAGDLFYFRTRSCGCPMSTSIKAPHITTPSALCCAICSATALDLNHRKKQCFIKTVLIILCNTWDEQKAFRTMCGIIWYQATSGFLIALRLEVL